MLQKLTGASSRWMINSRIISAFSNPTSTGGITTEQRLKMTAEKFNQTVGDSRNKKYGIVQERIRLRSLQFTICKLYKN